MARILIIDDEKNIILTLGSIFEDEGHETFSCEKGEEAFEIIEKEKVDLAIVDVWLPDVDGIELLSRLQKQFPDLGVIMISGHGSIDIAVKSTRMGAFDFLEKPPSMSRVITSVNNALERIELRRENIRLREKSYAEDEMVGDSPPMKEIREIIRTAAATNARVFIHGESGTGKELIARAIYQYSTRSDKPFIKVNCAAIPQELIESELFGHEKGAFTGAHARRRGKFELADKGTIFLDEICDMSLAAQAKVLRVLQEQQFERVGGNETIEVDVRVIAATNIDVKKAIDEGQFREDLYYRLNVIPIISPPLSKRKEDIPVLVNYFLKRFSSEYGNLQKELTDRAMNLLVSQDWPGNVRELKNVIERISVMISDEIVDDNDIKRYMEGQPDPGESAEYEDKRILQLKKARELFEKDYIVKALQVCEKNISRTARELGIERSHLHRKINAYGIDIDRI